MLQGVKISKTKPCFSILTKVNRSRYYHLHYAAKCKLQKQYCVDTKTITDSYTFPSSNFTTST